DPPGAAWLTSQVGQRHVGSNPAAGSPLQGQEHQDGSAIASGGGRIGRARDLEQSMAVQNRRNHRLLVAAILAALTTLATGAAGLLPVAAQASKEPVFIGVSGPLTGQYAQYGAQWRKGFDLALDEVNAGGAIKGRTLQYVFEDSQSDPRQTINIARKFVADERIAVEV